MRIIFPNKGVLPDLPDDHIRIIIPSGDVPVEQLALMDVPQGVPYLFVNDEDIPADRTYRNAWEADFSNPDGYGGQP